MALIKQSTARNRMVLMVDAADHVTGKTGLTLTIRLSKDGAAFATVTPIVTELEAGFYSLALTSSESDTLGDLAYHISGGGADPTDFVDQVVEDLSGGWDSVLEGTLTASDLLRVAAAVAAGKDTIVDTGSGSADVTFRDVSDTTDLVVGHVVASRRTSVVITP